MYVFKNTKFLKRKLTYRLFCIFGFKNINNLFQFWSFKSKVQYFLSIDPTWCPDFVVLTCELTKDDLCQALVLWNYVRTGLFNYRDFGMVCSTAVFILYRKVVKQCTLKSVLKSLIILSLLPSSKVLYSDLLPEN